MQKCVSDNRARQTDKEYRKELETVVCQARRMHERGEYCNQDYGDMMMAVAALVTDSEYGVKSATVEYIVSPGNRDWRTVVLDDSFDGCIFQMAQIAEQMIGRYGRVHAMPYTRGIDTYSTTLSFTPHKR